MISVFHGNDGDTHQRFQAWRKANVDGFHMTESATGQFTIHYTQDQRENAAGRGCRHQGTSDNEYLEDGCYTTARKVCSKSLAELIAWATEHGFITKSCRHCDTKRFPFPTVSPRAVRLPEEVTVSGQLIEGAWAFPRGVDIVSEFRQRFNPSIDRFDRRSVARLFQWLWPDAATSRACARNLAASVRCAHEAGEASWGLTMDADRLRLNVGPVEALTLDKEGCRFLFRAPLKLRAPSRYKISPARYKLGIPIGVCLVPAAKMMTVPSVVRNAHNAYIQAAASRRRVCVWKESFSPAVLEYLETALDEPLPRPSYLTPELLQRVEPLPDELDTSASIREGGRYLVTVNAYERDPRARQVCIARYGTACVICGFSFGARYGKVAEGFIHVHHLRPLGDIGKEHEVNPIEDLRPVCPNCHAVLHRRVPAYSIEEVQAFLTTDSA